VSELPEWIGMAKEFCNQDDNHHLDFCHAISRFIVQKKFSPDVAITQELT